VIFRKPFGDLIERQLALFERDNADLLTALVAAEQRYDRAERGEAEDRYSAFLDLVETAGEALADIRDHFAATLDDDAADAYTRAFNRAAVKRWPRLAVEL
jgi:hypothetical protein